MAAAAVHRMGDGLAWANARGIDLGVALAAGDFDVARAGDFGHAHEHRTAIGSLQVLIAVATHAIGVGHALGIENVAHLVGLVAVHTSGEDVRLLLPECTLDGLAVHLLDLGVAAGTGGGDVA